MTPEQIAFSLDEAQKEFLLRWQPVAGKQPVPAYDDIYLHMQFLHRREWARYFLCVCRFVEASGGD